MERKTHNGKANSWRKTPSPSPPWIDLLPLLQSHFSNLKPLGFKLSQNSPFIFHFFLWNSVHFLATMISSSKIKSVDFYRLGSPSHHVFLYFLFPSKFEHFGFLDQLFLFYLSMRTHRIVCSRSNLQLQCRCFRQFDHKCFVSDCYRW